MRYCVCTIAASAVVLFQAQAGPVIPPEVPFDLREGLIWIKASVPQSPKPLNLLLDTGAGASVISLTTADRLGLKLGTRVIVHGVGTTVTGHWLTGIAAHAGDVALPSDYVAVDLARLSTSCERPVDGLLGMDFFRGRAVQIDFTERKLRILEPGQVPTTGENLPIQLRPCGMRVPITVDSHQRQWVRLDTGCATPLQWVSSCVSVKDCNPKIAIGLTEVSVPQGKTVVEIGHQKFVDVPTGLHEHPIFAGEAGLLGTGLLSHFSRITIDSRSRRLLLEPSSAP